MFLPTRGYPLVDPCKLWCSHRELDFTKKKLFVSHCQLNLLVGLVSLTHDQLLKMGTRFCVTWPLRTIAIISVISLICSLIIRLIMFRFGNYQDLSLPLPACLLCQQISLCTVIYLSNLFLIGYCCSFSWMFQSFFHVVVYYFCWDITIFLQFHKIY